MVDYGYGDCSSLESITTITDFPNPQLSDINFPPSIVFSNSSLTQISSITDGVSFYEHLSTLRLNITKCLSVDGTEDEYNKLQLHLLMETCDTVKDMYTADILKLTSVTYNLREQIEQLHISNKRLTQQNYKVYRKKKILKEANDCLNEYIISCEDHHSKEIGNLQAKLSLVRIEKQLQEPITPEIPLTPQNPSQDSSTPKLKKRRRSLLFWKRNSKSLSNIDTGSIINSSGNSFNTNSKSIALEEEIKNKCVEVENLKSKYKNLEKKESVLEKAITQKNIEINSRDKRIVQLRNDINQDNATNTRCYWQLRNFSKSMTVVLQNVDGELKSTQKSRMVTQQSYKNIRIIDKFIQNLNEENKKLLGRINTANYELTREHTKSDCLISTVKNFIFSMLATVSDEKLTRLTEDREYFASLEEQYEKEGLEYLMQSLKEQIVVLKKKNQANKDLRQNERNYTGLDDLGVNIPKNMRFESPSYLRTTSSTAREPLDLGVTDSKNTINSKDDCDSGLAIDDYDRYRAQLHQQYKKLLDGEDVVRKILFDKEFSQNNRGGVVQNILSYVQLLKDIETRSYRQDYKQKVDENRYLKTKLSSASERSSRAEAELRYRKTFNCSNNSFPSTPQQFTTQHSHNRTSFRKRCTYSDSELSNRYSQFFNSSSTPDFETYSSADNPAGYLEFNFGNTEKSYERKSLENIVHGKINTLVQRTVEDDTLNRRFTNSFEKGTDLMQKVIESKQELEKQIEFSRQNIHNTRIMISRNMNTSL